MSKRVKAALRWGVAAGRPTMVIGRLALGRLSLGRMALGRLALGLVLAAVAAAHAHADDVAGFYRGKQVRLVVGYGTGGGYDVYARLLAKILGRHIPGSPTVIVQNMPGAGSLRAANFIYAGAPKDGTTIAT